MRNLQYGIPMAMAANVVALLRKHNQMVVFSESCTAGEVSAAVGQVGGASNCLCGSFVTYRPSVKMSVLGVSEETINKYTTESLQTAMEMALGALRVCEEANWSASIVGHFGPGSPEGKDGLIYYCIVERGNLKRYVFQDFAPPGVWVLETYGLTTQNRVDRQLEATELLLSVLHRCVERRFC